MAAFTLSPPSTSANLEPSSDQQVLADLTYTRTFLNHTLSANLALSSRLAEVERQLKEQSQKKDYYKRAALEMQAEVGRLRREGLEARLAAVRERSSISRSVAPACSCTASQVDQAPADGNSPAERTATTPPLFTVTVSSPGSAAITIDMLPSPPSEIFKSVLRPELRTPPPRRTQIRDTDGRDLRVSIASPGKSGRSDGIMRRLEDEFGGGVETEGGLKRCRMDGVDEDEL